MIDIKTKQRMLKSVKKLNKNMAWTERLKDGIRDTKDETKTATVEDLNQYEYGNNKIKNTINRISDETINSLNKKIINNRSKSLVVKRKKDLAIEKIRTTTKKSKKAGRAAIETTKKIIAALKSTISLLISGGIISIVVIVCLCAVAILSNSVFGIFLSSEKDNKNEISINQIISDCNNELVDKIDSIRKNNPYDEIRIESTRTSWKDILKVYVVKVTNGDTDDDVITLNNKKVKKLKNIFWDMTKVTHKLKNENIEGEDKKVLIIKIDGLSITNMELSKKQKEQLKNIGDIESTELWEAAIYGNKTMTSVANVEIGNVGNKYWEYFDRTSKSEWCAMFVSWVANQLGYIQNNTMPKFAGCGVGVTWFKEHNRWKDSNYAPKENDIIFFDWEQDGLVDHVGIVKKVENSRIYTIEGNSIGNVSRENNYSIYDSNIYGYGTS